MTIYEKIKLFLGMGPLKFDSVAFITHKHRRRLFVKDIMQNDVGVGLTKGEIEQLFGAEKTVRLDNVWCYALPPRLWQRGEGSDTLNFYFSEEDIVTQIKTLHRLYE